VRLGGKENGVRKRGSEPPLSEYGGKKKASAPRGERERKGGRSPPPLFSKRRKKQGSLSSSLSEKRGNWAGVIIEREEPRNFEHFGRGGEGKKKLLDENENRALGEKVSRPPGTKKKGEEPRPVRTVVDGKRKDRSGQRTGGKEKEGSHSVCLLCLLVREKKPVPCGEGKKKGSPRRTRGKKEKDLLHYLAATAKGGEKE